MDNTIRGSDIEKFIIIVLMLNALKIFGVFGLVPSKPLIITTITSCLIVVCFALDRKCIGLSSNYQKSMLLVLSIAIILASIKSSADGKKIALEIQTYGQAFLSIPIYSLLCRSKWSLNGVIKSVIFFSFVGYIIRYGISYIQHFTGMMFFQGVYLETIANGNWFRNGFMRINPPCFGNMIIPLCIYMMAETNKKAKKLVYACIILMAVFYSYRVHASRSVILYQILVIIVIIYVRRRSAKTQLLVMSVFLAGAVAAAEFGLIKRILAQFSMTNEKYGYSTYSRILSLYHYGVRFLKSPITGVGFLSESDQRFMRSSTLYYLEGGHISDIGFLYSIFQMGIFMVVFYVLFFSRCANVGIKWHTKKSNYDILAWGIALSIFMTGLNIDLFYSVYVFSAPFAIAIIEYLAFMHESEFGRSRLQKYEESI